MIFVSQKELSADTTGQERHYNDGEQNKESIEKLNITAYVDYMEIFGFPYICIRFFITIFVNVQHDTEINGNKRDRRTG